jgi:hypothetical protein
LRSISQFHSYFVLKFYLNPADLKRGQRERIDRLAWIICAAADGMDIKHLVRYPQLKHPRANKPGCARSYDLTYMEDTEHSSCA